MEFVGDNDVQSYNSCNNVINVNFALSVSYPTYCDTDEEISHVSVYGRHFCFHSVSRDVIVISISS